MGLHDRNFETAASEPAMEAAPLLHAGNIVRQFLVYLKANPIERAGIVNIDELPLPKASLINAFRLLIASEVRLKQRAQLQKAGLLLAWFQAVEPEMAEQADDPLESWIDTVQDTTASKDGCWLAAYREQEKLTELFEISARMAERRSMDAADASDEAPENCISH